MCIPTLYNSWRDPFLDYDPLQLIALYEPFVQRLLNKQSSVLRQFMANIASLHQTATKGSSHQSFVSDEDKQLLKQFSLKLQKTKLKDSELLAQISDVALSKAQRLWLTSYNTLITEPLICYLATAYAIDVKSFKTFPTTFPLTAIPPPPAAAPTTAIQPNLTPNSKNELMRQKREIVVESKSAHTRATHVKVMVPDFNELNFSLDGMTFIEPLEYDGYMDDLAVKVWKAIRNKQANAWLARWVVDPKTNKKYMQPGLLSGLKHSMRCEWLSCKTKTATYYWHTQLEEIDDDVPCTMDSYVCRPFHHFSETLWREGSLKMLPADFHIPKP
jgi:hypothetical protein